MSHCDDIILRFVGGIRSTVITRWTAGQQVERSTLHQGHDSQTTSSHKPRLSAAQYSLNSAELWPKTVLSSFYFVFCYYCDKQLIRLEHYVYCQYCQDIRLRFP